MKLIGMKARDITSLLYILSAILHLNMITFINNQSNLNITDISNPSGNLFLIFIFFFNIFSLFINLI